MSADPPYPQVGPHTYSLSPTACRLGPAEHDGSRFCHEHAGRVHAGSSTPWVCGERSEWSICWACGRKVKNSIGHECEMSDD